MSNFSFLIFKFARVRAKIDFTMYKIFSNMQCKLTEVNDSKVYRQNLWHCMYIPVCF